MAGRSVRFAPGDVIRVDLGVPVGSEAGFVRPAVVVSARDWLDHTPSSIFAVPLTTTKRNYPSNVEVAPDAFNGLIETSYAQVELLRSISSERVIEISGNTGPSIVGALRDIAQLLLDLRT